MEQVRIFTSYSHEDEDMRKSLAVHLSPLVREGTIDLWADRSIEAGDEWSTAIKEQLENSNVILLLISGNFLASDYCYDLEMTRAIERHDEGDAVVVPVILRPADWQSSPFAKLQALPRNAKPITTWRNRDDAYADVAKGIRRIAKRILATQKGLPQSEDKSISDSRTTSQGDSGGGVATETASTDIELYIDIDYASFDDKKKRQLLDAIGKLLEVDEEIRVVRKRRGSVKLTLRLTPEQAERVLWAAKGGALAAFAVIDAEITGDDIYEGHRQQLDIIPGISNVDLDIGLDSIATIIVDCNVLDGCLSFLYWDEDRLTQEAALNPSITSALFSSQRIGYSSYRRVYNAIRAELSRRGIKSPLSHYIL